MTLDELILGARRDGASDLHLTGGAAPAVRILGQLVPWGDTLDEATVEALLSPVLTPRLRA